MSEEIPGQDLEPEGMQTEIPDQARIEDIQQQVDKILDWEADKPNEPLKSSADNSAAFMKGSEGYDFPEFADVTVALTNGHINTLVDLRVPTKDYNQSLTNTLLDQEQNGFRVTGVKGHTDLNFFNPDEVLGAGWRGGTKSAPGLDGPKR